MAAGPILALDLGTTTGWCLGRPGERPQLGAVLLEGKSIGSRGGAMDDWLWGMCGTAHPSMIVFEAPLPHHSSINAGRLALGLAMVVEIVGHRLEIMTRECAVTSVRKRVLGKGRAEKDEVVAWCRSQGWTVPTHDAADAALLWELACRVRDRRANFD